MRTIIKAYPGLVFSTYLLFFLLLLRMCIHGRLQFAFLVWNVFLAFIPLAISHGIHRIPNFRKAYPYIALWLLFYPNAAYLITDIVHLEVRPSPDFWLDVVILFGAAMIGVVIAVRSLARMESWYAKHLSPMWTNAATILVLLVSGYGIYLGRVGRWNSWDVLFSTGDLVSNVAYQFFHPFQHIEVWLLSTLFATALGMAYLVLGRYKAR
jgi:uncharacterized membrane protein